MPIIIQLFDFIPALLLFILFPHCPSSPEMILYIYSCAPVFILLLIWIAIRTSVNRYVNTKKSKQEEKNETKNKRIRSLMPYFIMALCGFTAIMLMLTFQVIKLRFTPAIFYLSLTFIGLDAISEGLTTRSRPILSLIPKFIAYTVLGYLSFYLINSTWQWQAMVFSCGIAFQLIALRIAFLLSKTEISKVPKSNSNGHPETPHCRLFKNLGKAYGITLFLGPTCIALLSLTHQIPKDYVLVYAIGPFAGQLITKVQQAAKTATLEKTFLRQNYAICLLYVLIIFMISLLHCSNLLNLL